MCIVLVLDNLTIPSPRRATRRSPACDLQLPTQIGASRTLQLVVTHKKYTAGWDVFATVRARRTCCVMPVTSLYRDG